jgi:hypothetical protein
VLLVVFSSVRADVYWNHSHARLTWTLRRSSALTLQGLLGTDHLNRQVRILSGLHIGAQTSCDDTARYLVGSDPACSIVLCDEGVAARHCLIAIDEFGMTCRAVDAAVLVDGREVRPGQAVSIEDLQVIQCGPVTLSVGPVLSDWSQAGRAARSRRTSVLNSLGSLKRVNPYVLFAAVLICMSGLLGLAYEALSEAKAEATPVHLEAARAWLQAVAPRASELQMNIDNLAGRQLLVSGYVARNQDLTALVAESRQSAFRPRVEVYAADEMVSSVSHVAQLAGIACLPRYKGGGLMECTKPLDSNVAARMQTIARDVPGLRSLEVHVATPVLAGWPAVAPASATAPAASAAPAVITQKFAVLMYHGGRYLVDPYGQRYREGEEFNSFKIESIRVDEVTFERDGHEYAFRVAALAVPFRGALR